LGIGKSFFGIEHVQAFLARISPGVNAGDPLLHASLQKPQINHRMPGPFYLFNQFAFTSRAAAALDGDYFIRMSVRAPMFSMALVDCFEMLMRSDKNLFPLVVEIGALHNVFKIRQCVFFGTKQLPTGTIFS